ncbi:MAG: hypothetical protein AABW46_00350 [Nanoarchaeota archaeon]
MTRTTTLISRLSEIVNGLKPGESSTVEIESGTNNYYNRLVFSGGYAEKVGRAIKTSDGKYIAHYLVKRK